MDKKKYISGDILKQLFFIAVILFLFITLFRYLSGFIPGFLGALCLYVLLIKPLRYMEIKWKMNRFLSVILLMLACVAIVVAPAAFLIDMLTKKNTDKIQAEIAKVIEEAGNRIGIDIMSEQNLSDATKFIIQFLRSILNISLDSLLQVGVAFLILYFMLMGYKSLQKAFYDYIPVTDKNLRLFTRYFRDLVISNAVGVPVVAFLQAVVAYIGYLIFGVNDAFLWFILTIFAAMLPIVGSAMVYVPVVAIMLANGETINAYLLLAYCFLIVGSVDNIFRFILQKKWVDVHPLITIFGVIVGLNLFGFIGIIFGPILFSVLFRLVELYKLEFSNPKDQELI